MSFPTAKFYLIDGTFIMAHDYVELALPAGSHSAWGHLIAILQMLVVGSKHSNLNHLKGHVEPAS